MGDIPPPPSPSTNSTHTKKLRQEIKKTLNEIIDMMNELGTRAVVVNKQSYNQEQLHEKYNEAGACSALKLLDISEEIFNLFKDVKAQFAAKKEMLTNALVKLQSRHNTEREIDLQEGNRG